MPNNTVFIITKEWTDDEYNEERQEFIGVRSTKDLAKKFRDEIVKDDNYSKYYEYAITEVEFL